MMSGISTVITRKLLARMRSIYSRRAMSRTLRIDSASATHGLDEDLFQGRLRHFKPPDLRGLRGKGQQRLCVVAILQRDLGMTAVVLRRCDAGVLQKRIASLEVDQHAVVRIT